MVKHFGLKRTWAGRTAPARRSMQTEMNTGNDTENKASVAALMAESGVAFGTSGARGKADRITDRIAYAYTLGFLRHISARCTPGQRVAVGGDLRFSTERIARAVVRAVMDAGFLPVNAGCLPSPALTLFGIRQNIPAVMVTGSHIPGDENGLKFTTATGEITKEDEQGIRQQTLDIPDGHFDATGSLAVDTAVPEPISAPTEEYAQRYIRFFPGDFLSGKRLGLYEHTAVGRDVFRKIYEALGAEVVSFGRSDSFVPVDTEAIRDDDRRLARAFAREHDVDIIVSSDGDSDRPMVADENGNWLRGDVLGVLTARYLGADAVATPISSNSMVERCGWFAEVKRTRIGSPYVIAAMQSLSSDGYHNVAGYEANGGFLTACDICREDRTLAALPTRDAVIVHLAVLGLCIAYDTSISALVRSVQNRFTASGRIARFPRAEAHQVLHKLTMCARRGSYGKIEELLGRYSAPVIRYDAFDGLRVYFENDVIVHLRASGNSDDFRCYTEAESESLAERLVIQVLSAVQKTYLKRH